MLKKRTAANKIRLLSVKESATLLGVSDATVYRMLREGMLRGVRIRRLWRVHGTDLDRYCRAQKSSIEVGRDW